MMGELEIVAATMCPIVLVAYIGMSWLCLKIIKEKRHFASMAESRYSEIRRQREVMESICRAAERIDNANQALRWVRDLKAVLR